MKGQKIGYVRVSTVEQNIGRQLEGIEVDRIFIDHASGKNTDRPKFQEMLNYVREGDQVIVHSMDRFARSLKDLVTEVDQLVKRGIAIQFIKENITFTAQATPMDNLMLQLMGAFAQFEREIILERQKEGIRLAAAQGKYKGRVHKLKPDQAEELRQAWKEGKYSSKLALGKAYGISRQAVYRYLKASEKSI
ncbi:transposase [Acinetobacter sp. ANC 4558]|uniref:recombinase family protein n=1 Tax=Acinetobacter sp. ANC 4558 TaxID=1977876 RepID=UPI000A33B7FB|nr:recombinase family protein [Acinetobacter sp. ANC 4558]OTG79868.1 transposase [Acinetobacter sp. ANC 4558]